MTSNVVQLPIRTIRRCRYCNCSIDHKAERAKYCDTYCRTADCRLREDCRKELLSEQQDGALVPIPHAGEVAEDLGMDAWDETDRVLMGIMIVHTLNSNKIAIKERDAKIRELQAQLLRKLKDQA